MKLRIAFIAFITFVITVLIYISVSLYRIDAIDYSNIFNQVTSLDMSFFFEFYKSNIRGNLFAGLLAIGGFLMSAKTFILITMKQNVFDDAEYVKRFSKLKKLKPSMERYGPLIQLKEILYFSVYSTILASVSQMSIGLIPHWIASMLAIASAIFSVILVIDSLNLIKKNLDFWISDENTA